MRFQDKNGYILFITLLITDNRDHSDSILTPSTPSTHYPGPCQEQRGNLIYFYNQIYTAKMQHFAKQFAPTSGVSLTILDILVLLKFDQTE